MYSRRITTNTYSLTDKAKTPFFETVTAFNKIQIPDSKNFVKFDGTISASLDEVPILNETLRHVVPPQVRKMQAELNNSNKPAHKLDKTIHI